MSSLRRLGSLLVVCSLLTWACGSSGESGAGPISRTVLVDYNHDEFAGSFLAYFPQVIEVRPGDTIDFKQAWTGEGHSVTLGTLVDTAIKPVRELMKAGPLPDAPPPEIEAALLPLPFMLGDDLIAHQAAAQPCYLDSGAPPEDRYTPCPKRPQPEFNGRQSYFSSGLIPYEGTGGNTYRVKLSDDIAPGTYTYYCNLHGPLQSGEIVVKPKGTKVESQSTVDKRGRSELQEMAKPLLKAYEQAKKGRAQINGEPFRGNLAGYYVPEFEHAFLSEFIPRTIRAKTGEKVTWTNSGGHTVSFDVPPYFPEFLLAPDGTVTLNPQAYEPVNSPEVPRHAFNPFAPEPPPPTIDAGRWDGSSFVSSGLLPDGATYSLTFTRPGRYRYACLVHPRMVGEVVVS